MRRRQGDALARSRDALDTTQLPIGGAERDERVRLGAQRPLFPRHVNGGLTPFSRRREVEIQVGKLRDLRVRAGELLALSERLEEPHRILCPISRSARFAEEPAVRGDPGERQARASGVAGFLEPSPGLFGRAECAAWHRGELRSVGEAKLKVAEPGFIVSG